MPHGKRLKYFALRKFDGKKNIAVIAFSAWDLIFHMRSCNFISYFVFYNHF